MTESTLTIVFRGLMVFHKTVGPLSQFEVGLLTPHHGNSNHIPRISTYKNGVLYSVKRIDGLYPEHRIWQLNVVEPLGGVSTDEQGTFKRAQETHPKDYRWLIDLEDSAEFYGSLAGKIDTCLLNPVLRIPSGRFYTRLQSDEMIREKDGQPENFGMLSAAVGCDIRLRGCVAKLDAGAGNVFTFNVDPTGNTLYEIANTPPDTHVPATCEDHFQHYYEIFTTHVPKYKFSPMPGVTGPSPALCGSVRLGQMRNDL